jgi:hypothetical protein
VLREEEEKRADIAKCIAEQIEPLKQTETETFQKEIKDSEELKVKLEKIIEEYSERERIYAEQDKVRKTEFGKFEDKINELIATEKEDAKQIVKTKAKNEGLAELNKDTKQRIENMLNAFQESQADVSKLHSDMDTTSADVRELQLTKTRKELEKKELEGREQTHIGLVKRKKQLEKLCKTMKHEIEDLRAE